MKIRFGAFASLVLAVMTSTVSVSVPPVLAEEAADQFSGGLYIFFDPQKYRSMTEGKLTIPEAAAVPEKIRQVPFLVMVTVAGCKAGADGRCNVTVDYHMFDPNEKQAINNPGRAVWTKAPQAKGIMMFSEEPVPAMFQSSDPAGIYKLKLVLHDNVAKTTFEYERAIVLEN